MVTTTELLFLGVAAFVLLWGFERYRVRFVRTDLVIASVVAGGLAAFVLVPGLFYSIGNVFDIRKRFVVASLIGSLTLLAILLYVIGRLRLLRTEMTELNRALSVDQAPETDGGTEQLYVVIPAYNEGDTIRSVVDSLPERVCGYEVQPLVVCDGCVDDTAEQAQYSGATVVEHHVNQGQGGALKTGFEIAIENDAAIVVTMDADGQHPADELDRLVRPIVEDRADYVMGSRYLGIDESGNGTVREAGIQFFTRVINVLTKSDITDCTNGYRAIRGLMLEDLTLTEERFSAPELIIEARKNGLRIEEIPVTIEEREAGETKKPQVGYALGLSRTILATWIR
ncbi:glycosyltransferase [Halosimplex rubrum]|uniref:Glycosyltransferase n=1 Tax=Halosimplex rubrum TaxID=869889 RepID=A0A7D5P3U9_9EURY|nr:glycosyltransferase family 2 protein [Halosimplex rubrum]QLH76865.1 glycosyltransferase [Halosimplex rubrum]